MTKNDLINDVISSLISAFTSEQLEIIKSTFIVKMQNYDIHELCTLPSTEVMDNLYIFKRFSVDMLAKGLKQSTIKTYLTYIRQFFAHSNKNYREITSQDLTDYFAFLKSGGSRYPIESLRVAGVDMESVEPVQAACDTFKEIVDKLKKLF